MAESFNKKLCKTCKTPLFDGWVENPIYRGEEEGMVELYIGYCPTCNKVEHSIIKADIYED